MKKRLKLMLKGRQELTKLWAKGEKVNWPVHTEPIEKELKMIWFYSKKNEFKRLYYKGRVN